MTALETAVEAVIELGKRQRRMQGAHIRIGEFCRLRELAGDRPARVEADYWKWINRINRAIDPYRLNGEGMSMTHFRIRYERRGGHTHMAVFAGTSRAVTHGKCGDLCMTNEEFVDFQRVVKAADAEFVEVHAT